MNRHKIPTVTIGIPALNEGKNIKNLLVELLRQKVGNGKVVEIIVASDGSLDGTVAEVKSLKNSEIKVISGMKRRGKAYRENQIISLTKSDILVLVDADITIPSRKFLEKLIAPIVSRQVHLTSSALIPLPPQNYFESVIYLSIELKNLLFDQVKEGNNLFNCHGPARAFSKRLYKKLRFGISEGEDMYSYLYCVLNGYKFKYVRSAKIFYKLPSNIYDHYKQSIRYVYSKEKSVVNFDRNGVLNELKIPIPAYINSSIKAFPILFKNPFKVFLYVCIYLLANIKYFLGSSWEEMWQVESSKKL